MTAMLLEMLESLSLQWPIALTFMSFPIGLSIWLIRHRSGRWSSNSLILSGLGDDRRLIKADDARHRTHATRSGDLGDR